MAHPNISDATGLVVYFDAAPQEVGDILSTSLGVPVLRWSTSELTNQDFETTAYAVMRQWLEFDRWNRRHRRLGMQVNVAWETNCVPSKKGTSFLWNPERAGVSLVEVVPAVQMLLSLSMNEPDLAIPVLGVVSWLRNQNIEPDPGNVLAGTVLSSLTRQEALKILEKNPEADVVVSLDVLASEPGQYVLREIAGGRSKPWTQRTEAFNSLEAMRAVGLNVEVAAESQQVTVVGLDMVWLSKGQSSYEVIARKDGMFLLREIGS